MSRPMPSPRGTNFEHLAMPDAVAAYDAALGDDVMRQLTSFLADKLTPEDMATVKSLLGSEDEPESPSAEDAYRTKMRGLHRSGLISDSALVDALHGRKPPTAAQTASFAERYPDAARIKLG